MMKKDHMLFPIVFIIYIAAGLISVVLFYTKGSNLSHQLDAATVINDQAPDSYEPADGSSQVIGEVSDGSEPADPVSDVTSPDAPAGTEAESSNELSAASGTAGQSGELSGISDTAGQSSELSGTAGTTGQPDEASAESGTDEAPGETPEPDDTTAEPAEDASDDADVDDDGTVYYAFSVNKDVSAVRIRESEDRNSSIVGRVSAGDKGYILEKGDKRSKIVTEDGSVTGYIYNEYIQISEIPKNDYPEEYR